MYTQAKAGLQQSQINKYGTVYYELQLSDSLALFALKCEKYFIIGWLPSLGTLGGAEVTTDECHHYTLVNFNFK